MAAQKSPHAISLLNTKPLYSSPLGSIQKITSPELPILKNLSIKSHVIAPGSILDNGNVFSHFSIDAGKMFHIHSGSLHCIENVGDVDAKFIIAFRHENPEDFSLSASFGPMSDSVLGNTYDVKAVKFEAIKRDTQPKYIVKREGKPTIPSSAKFPNSH